MEVRVEDFAEKLTAKFMDEQFDSWVVNLYKFLHEGRGQIYSHFLKRPLIRLEGGKHVPPFSDNYGTPNAYLPTVADSDLPTVKRSIARDKKVLEFLTELKLQVPDISDEVIKTVLPRYESGKSVAVEVWKKDFKKILAALQCQDNAKLFRLKEKLRVSNWVLAQTQDAGSLCFVSPSMAYVITDELRMYFGRDEEARFLADGYFAREQVETLITLGVARSPRMNSREPGYDGYVILADYHGWHKRGLAGFDPEWTVDGLEKALTEPSLDVSAFVWNRIVVPRAHLIRGVIESSSRKTFEGARQKEEWSGTGQLLRDTAWLPDGSGSYCKPGDLMLIKLPGQFDRESPQAKRLAEALNMKQPEAAKAIDALSGGNDRLKAIIERLTRGDLDDDFLDKLDKLFPRPEPVRVPPTFRDAVQSVHRKGTTTAGEEAPPPGGEVQNPDRYVEKLKEDIANRRGEQLDGRAGRFVVIRERDDNKGARQFLYQQYSGKCQVSGQTFSKADGTNYYVAVSLIPYQGTDYLNHAGNMLCLCADVAARFMYGTFEWLDDLGEKIEAFKAATSGGAEQHRTIRIRLASDERAIRFSEAHFLRLKALWEAG